VGPHGATWGHMGPHGAPRWTHPAQALNGSQQRGVRAAHTEPTCLCDANSCRTRLPAPAAGTAARTRAGGRAKNRRACTARRCQASLDTGATHGASARARMQQQPHRRQHPPARTTHAAAAAAGALRRSLRPAARSRASRPAPCCRAPTQT
jgi:hypothetical protein